MSADKKKPKVTSSTNRAYRAKAAASAARKKTTSSGRGAGPNPKVDSRKTRQSNQTAKVTGSGSKAPSTPSTAKVTRGKGSFSATPQKAPSVPKPKPSAQKGGGIKGGVQAAVAGEVMRARPVADGTLKGKPTGPAQGPKAPARLSQQGINKMSFDDAFRQARKSGAKTFAWRGKSYNTKVK